MILIRSISNSISCHFFGQFQIRSLAIGCGFETKNNRFELLNLKRLFRRIRRRILPEPNFCRLEPKSF